MALGILFLWPGVEPIPPAVQAQSLNHWTTREFLKLNSSNIRKQA